MIEWKIKEACGYNESQPTQTADQAGGRLLDGDYLQAFSAARRTIEPPEYKSDDGHLSLAKLFRPDVNVLSLNYLIRKCAHFLAYLVLGIIVLFAMRRIGFSGKKGILWTLLICISYAITDELHQGFVPGRTPKLMDVVIDSSGALLGIGLFRLFIEGGWKQLIARR